MRTLVTGGAGFIGSHVVDRLVQLGKGVVVLDNLDPQVHQTGSDLPVNIERHVVHGAIEFMKGDVRDRATVERVLQGVDTIVHLAAAVGVGQSMYQPHYYTSNNVDAQGVLFEAMVPRIRQFRRFVVASSMSIYGEGAYRCAEHGAMAPEPRPEDRLAAGLFEMPCPVCGRDLEPVLTREDKPLQATSIYSVTKKTQEELALCFGRAYRIPTLALRFFNVFGSRQALSNPYTGAAAVFMSRLKNGNRPLIFEDGRQTRDFIHVHDLADAVVAAAEREEVPFASLNICTGRPVSIAGVARALAERLGVRIEPDVVGRFRVGDIRHCVGDPAEARRVLGFSARRSFAEGLDELVRWSETQEAIDRVEESLAELERQQLVR